MNLKYESDHEIEFNIYDIPEEKYINSCGLHISN